MREATPGCQARAPAMAVRSRPRHGEFDSRLAARDEFDGERRARLLPPSRAWFNAREAPRVRGKSRAAGIGHRNGRHHLGEWRCRQSSIVRSFRARATRRNRRGARTWRRHFPSKKRMAPAGGSAPCSPNCPSSGGVAGWQRRTRDPGRRVRRREAGRGKPGRLSGLQRQLTACGRAALRRRWQDRAAAPSGRRKGGRSEGPAAERRCSPAGIDGNSKLPWRPAPPAGVWPAAADARIEGIRAASRPCLAVRRWIWTSSTRFWRSCG